MKLKQKKQKNKKSQQSQRVPPKINLGPKVIKSLQILRKLLLPKINKKKERKELALEGKPASKKQISKKAKTEHGRAAILPQSGGLKRKFL